MKEQPQGGGGEEGSRNGKGMYVVWAFNGERTYRVKMWEESGYGYTWIGLLLFII